MLDFCPPVPSRVCVIGAFGSTPKVLKSTVVGVKVPSNFFCATLEFSSAKMAVTPAEEADRLLDTPVGEIVGLAALNL